MCDLNWYPSLKRQDSTLKLELAIITHFTAVSKDDDDKQIARTEGAFLYPQNLRDVTISGTYVSGDAIDYVSRLIKLQHKNVEVINVGTALELKTLGYNHSRPQRQFVPKRNQLILRNNSLSYLLAMPTTPKSLESLQGQNPNHQAKTQISQTLHYSEQ